jgi:hypothetical protein
MPVSSPPRRNVTPNLNSRADRQQSSFGLF